MGDLISRQDAIDAALSFIVEYCGAAFDEDMQMQLKQRLEDLSSVQPERKTGRWIEDDAEMFVTCSECGESNDYISDFCPNCGADMRGEQE